MSYFSHAGVQLLPFPNEQEGKVFYLAKENLRILILSTNIYNNFTP